MKTLSSIVLLLTVTTVWADEASQRSAPELATVEAIAAEVAALEARASSLRVHAHAKVRQRTGFDRDAPELKRKIDLQFAVDKDGRLRSQVDGDSPGRSGTVEVLPNREIGVFDGKLVRVLRGAKEYTHGYIGNEQSRIPREVDPRNYLFHFSNERISERLLDGDFVLLPAETWQDRKVVVLESKPVVQEKVSYKSRILLDPALDYTPVVRSLEIRYEDIGPDWYEYSRTESSEHTQTADGVWLPARGLYTSLNASRKEIRRGLPLSIAWQFDVTFDNWQLNPTFNDNDFTFDFPAGVYVQDER